MMWCARPSLGHRAPWWRRPSSLKPCGMIAAPVRGHGIASRTISVPSTTMAPHKREERTMMPTPMEQTSTELQHAYNVFNAQLFDGQLPPCCITMQRKHRTYGYVPGERWNNLAGTVTDAIAMHPMHCATQSAAEILSTLAHAMVHLWQHHCGTPSRRAYHNREWAAKMAAIGLEPSDTGCPGGKRTGQRMSQYIRD